MTRASLLAFAAVALPLAAGCKSIEYRYADDAKVAYSEGEKVASVKAQLGCPDAHPANESDDDKKEREKRDPKTDLGKKWLARACEIADAFEKAGPVTSWPEGKAVYEGERICRPQITRVVGDDKTAADAIDPSAYDRLGRMTIEKGEGQKLWPDGPDVDKSRVLGYRVLFDDVSFKVTKDKLGDIDAFWKKVAAGENPDVEALRKDESADARQKSDETEAIVAKHNVPGMLLKSDGKSTLAYPILHMTDEPDAPSAIHYIRQAGDKLLVASPLLGESQPNACVAELTLQK
jgi:hypothetical protein